MRCWTHDRRSKNVWHRGSVEVAGDEFEQDIGDGQGTARGRARLSRGKLPKCA